MTATRRVWQALAAGVREYARSPVLVALLVVLPFAFITVSIVVTPVTHLPVYTKVDGFAVSVMATMPEVHGVVMTPITTAFITGLAGLFLMQSATAADGRLRLTGYRPAELVVARFATLALVAVLVTGVAVAVMLMDFRPERLGWFVLGVLVVTLVYGLLGMLVGVVSSRLAGMYVMLFAPMMDVGVFQDPMFVRGEPAWWMKLFPGYFPLRMLFDAGFTSGIDTVDSFLVSLGILAVLASVTTVAFARQTRVR